tara:strand:+ start:311 stop:1078 length:768 start_codon:yes stop_codon:yes gene_type:complete
MKEQVSLTPELFKGKSLLITTPAYGGMVNSTFALSIATLCKYLQALQIKHDVFFLNNESLISRGRNTCVARFMALYDFSHMIFIDADTIFEAQDVLKFLHSDEDVLTGPVPVKTLPVKYNVYTLRDENNNVISYKDKFLEMNSVGTAFMMIKRKVFEKMFEAYPELKYRPYEESIKRLYLGDKEEKYLDSCYALFDCGLNDTIFEDEQQGVKRYVAEDYMFCHRWRKIGGKILLDPNVKLNHVGTHIFEGDLSKL